MKADEWLDLLHRAVYSMEANKELWDAIEKVAPRANSWVSSYQNIQYILGEVLLDIRRTKS